MAPLTRLRRLFFLEEQPHQVVTSYRSDVAVYTLYAPAGEVISTARRLAARQWIEDDVRGKFAGRRLEWPAGWYVKGERLLNDAIQVQLPE